jgi:predicted ATPase/class 3 adenylate cyclase
MDPAPPTTAPARALPEAGTLTFLFTDVDRSTPLWERHEATMRAVTARHDALLDAIIVAHAGTLVKERGEGDSLFAVFTAPAAAVAAALAMARAVLAESWPPETPIRVRMGLHTGNAQLRAGDYYGPVVNRCARIRGLGHGGQVLLSAATAGLVRDALPAGASLRSLGAHSLKGLFAPEEVYQLCHFDLPDAFPPLLSPQAPRHNLPLALSSLIGREADQGEVLALLAEARLVTLTGTGGVGKTRLALAVAAELVDQYPDGVWLAELAALAESELATGAVAQALGVREEPGRPLTATLIAHLKAKRLLLVLDNCEHLVGACAALAGALLRACPGLRILATSREGLEIAGEHRYRVPSLSVPDPRHLPPPELTGSYEAVRLFVARATERRPYFGLTPQNARMVAAVCARLDGIPLAIELAAARVGSLSVEGIAARLDDRFRLLTGGARDALPRQRTLRAALDWSYDLLSEAEQALLDRLSVFAGGWTLTAAEVVGAGEGVEDWGVLDLLGSLVHKSLVQAEERAGGELRYALLETVRQYGLERLAAAGGAPAVRDRHLAHFLALAAEAEPHLTGAGQMEWLARLEGEHDNLRAALSWARAQADGERGLRLAAALCWFWYMRGDLSEGRGWLAEALARASTAPAALRATALNGAGNLASDQGEYGQAEVLYEQALALRRELGDTRGIAGSLSNLAGVAERRGDYGRAVPLFEEALTLARVSGDTLGIAKTLGNLGLALGQQGDIEREAALFEEALALFRALGDTMSIAGALDNLGQVAFQQGAYERARALHEEALALFRALEAKRGIAGSLTNLGAVAEREGAYGRATALSRESLLLNRAIGAEEQVVEGLQTMVLVAAARGQATRATQLAGAAGALREALDVPMRPHQQPIFTQAVQAIRMALGEEAFAAAWAEGQALALEEAVALALEGQAEASIGE